MDNSASITAMMEVPYFSGGPISTYDAALSVDKFSLAVMKAKEILSLNASNRANPNQDIKRKITEKTDRLLGFLLTQFTPDVCASSVSMIMDPDDVFDALDTRKLISLPEGTIPVAIFRVLAKTNIFIEDEKLDNWPPFAERYCHSIL